MGRIIAASALAFSGLLFVAGSALAQPSGARGGGPPFCANGNGHPVHGWSWCVAKGWAPSAGYGYPAEVRGWDRYSWDDARFRDRRPVRDDRWLNHRELARIVGDRIMVRLEAHSGRRDRRDRRDRRYDRREDRRADHRADRRSELRARWVRDRGFEGVALQVAIGSTTVAFLQDLSRDGRVDRVYMRPR